MTIANNFIKLDQNLLCRIFFKSGNILELSKVCKLFNEVLISGSKRLYGTLIAEFGENCLCYIVNGMKLEKKSDSIKINGLFFAASPKSSPLNRRGIDYNIQTLRRYMRPLLFAESYRKLWSALLKAAHPQLKSLMLKVPFQQRRPLANATLIQNFFKLNSLEIEKITVLDLSGQELKILPPEIAYFSQLNKLDLSHNDLSELPEEICKLAKLTSLNLSNNRIRNLPDDIGNLQALNYLYLDGCQLTFLPLSLKEIPSLIGLYLYGNLLSELPSFLCKMQHLRFLSLKNNRLIELPESIGAISSLQSLFVDGNNLKELPQSICSLIHLKHLSISNNPLSSLPQEMQKLKQPIYFDCTGTCLDDSRLNNEGDVLNASMTKDKFQATYWGLKESKWKEGIDGEHHCFGPNVYDLGLHGKNAEPGFLNGVKNAFRFLSENFNRKIDVKFYLSLHKAACGHFAGEANNTLIGQEEIGVFRDADDSISATFSESCHHLITQSAINEFYDLNNELTLRFDASFRVGDVIFKSYKPRNVVLCYQALSRKQVEIIFNYFLNEFYYDIGHADKPDSKVRAIAKFIQRLEWLHPLLDGCGRTDTALLNYLLTVYGFNPVLLKYPYISSSNGLNDFTSQLITGIFDWQKEARRVQSGKIHS